MKAYIVGGAVRDQLLGQPVHDRDWVVVGATPQQLIDAGYKPVGRDFPVFLHPLSGEQYALARTERKAGRGYHGFTFHAAPEVTLEQDLARRDLTINAMALDPDTATLIDPFNGRADLGARVLRHVSSAFVEDPVRLLRVARFAARWPDFSVAPATQALLRQLVDDGEVDALVAERVWQEVSRGLMERAPSKMFELLRGCGALLRLAPELAALVDHDAGATAWRTTLRVLDAAAALALPLELRFACLTHRLADAFGTHEAASSALARLAERWRVDQPSHDLAALLLREGEMLRRAEALDAASTLALIERTDALRRPERFERLLQAWQIVARSVDGRRDGERGAARLRAALAAAQAIDVATLRARGQLAEASGPAVGHALRAARCDAIAEVFAKA